MPGYQTHLFICTNSPDKEGKCGSKDSEKLRRDVKELCKQEFGKDVRVNSAGCLGYCERGIAAVIYPSGDWLLDLHKKDADVIMKHMRKAHSESSSS